MCAAKQTKKSVDQFHCAKLIFQVQFIFHLLATIQAKQRRCVWTNNEIRAVLHLHVKHRLFRRDPAEFVLLPWLSLLLGAFSGIQCAFFACNPGAMMKWYWRQVNSDADECQNLLEGPLSKFTKIGPSGNLRLTHAWMEGHGNDFFLTLSTCCAFKFRLAHFHPQGLLLRRSCGTPDWLLCRFTRTEAPLIVTVDLQRGINETHVQCTLPSGTFVFDKVLSNSKTWWNLVTEMGASDVNVANVMMFLETKEIHRMFWNQRIIEQVQDINSKTMWEDLFATKESPQKVQAKKIAQKTKDHENKSKVEADEKAKVKKPPAMKVLKKPKTKVSKKPSAK